MEEGLASQPVTRPDHSSSPSSSTASPKQQQQPLAKRISTQAPSPILHLPPLLSTITSSSGPFALGGGMASQAHRSPIVFSPAPVALRAPGAFRPMLGSETAAMPSGLLMTTSAMHQGRMGTANMIETGKSIPIHCIVENGAKTGGGGGAAAAAESCKPPSASLLPRSSAGSLLNKAGDMDTFAVLAGSTLLSDVVRAALVKLGFSSAEAVGAKGTLQVRHWKPLTFDTISDAPNATVEQILGEIAPLVTLRIRLSSKTKAMAVEDIKEKLLRFLLQHSRGVLSSLGCPVDQNLLSQICRGSYHHIPEDVRDSFNHWFKAQTEATRMPSPPEMSQMSTPNHTLHRNAVLGRLRTSFDSEHETPRLQKWFSHNQHPSREQMMTYLKELNALEARQDRPLDLANVVYWFKNARAAQRRSNGGGTQRSEERDSQTASPVSSHDDDMDADKEEDELREEESQRKTPSPSDGVPELPNRNAVYVVQPLPPEEDEKIEIVHMNEDGKEKVRMLLEADVNHNKCLSLHAAEQHQEEATDLSMRSRKASNDSALNSSHESIMNKLKLSTSSSGFSSVSAVSAGRLKREREEDEDEELLDRYHSSGSSSTSSPRMHPVIPEGKSPALVQPQPPPHPVAASQFNQHAMQLAAMSHALNMQYFNPGLYGVEHGQFGMGVNGGQGGYKDDMDGSPSAMLDADRKKRSRVFIDPLSEIPKLEKWFQEDTHPSSYMIEKYTEELNMSTYRQRFPRLEPKNVQLWFKNHRAKVKRQRMEVVPGN